MDSPGKQLEIRVEGIKNITKKEMKSRAYRVSMELRNSANEVLSGHRNGRVYKVPGTYGKRKTKATKSMLRDYGHKLRGGQLYRASAPGEAPANRLGHFRMSWTMNPHSSDNGNTVHASIETRLKVKGGRLLGEILEEGHGMAPRPYQQKILDETEEKAREIFNEPYVE